MSVRPPDREHDSAEINELFTRAFSDYWEWYDLCPNGYIDGAPYDWEASRVAFVDDRMAAHFGVWDFSMRIGTAVVRVGGIGAVATDRQFRKHGLMTQTAKASVDSMKPCGYDMSLLFGIQKYYRRFGYVGTFSERIYGLKTRDLTPLEPQITIVPFDGEFAQFADQYNKENASVTGTFVRPTYAKNRRPQKWHGYTFDGGYLVAGMEGDVLSVGDCAGPPDAIVDAARQLAVRELARKIEFVFTPPRSSTGEYLQTITHTTRTAFVRDGGPMIKVVNLASLMDKLRPELSRRLSAGPMSDYSGSLVIDGDNETVELQIERGKIAGVASVPTESAQAADSALIAGDALGRLVIGDNDPVRIFRQTGMKIVGDAVHLIPILFPDQEPSTVLWDRF